MLTSVGPDFALVRLPSGKFDLNISTSGSNKGNPLLDGSRLHSVLTAVFSRKRGRQPGDTVQQGGYYWDTSGRRGTLLWTVTQDRQSTRSQLIAAAEDGLQQLVDEKIIQSFQVDAQRIGTGLSRWALYVTWTIPGAERKESFKL